MIKKQTGYSLVELMIASMIGLFLIFVVISSYSTNKTTSIQRTQLSELEANARIAMTFLRDGIEHAGYPSTYVHIIEKPFLTESDGSISGIVCSSDGSTATTQAASRINSSNRYTMDAGNSDKISIAYMPDNPRDSKSIYWADCTASYSTPVQAEKCSADPVNGQGHLAKIYNSYFISNDELKCTTSRNITIPIAQGIENIQFQYGVRINGSTEYKTATSVETSGEWSSVISVHVAMLVRSSKEFKPQDETLTYKLLDHSITTNDRYDRKVFTSLIHLVNRDR